MKVAFGQNMLIFLFRADHTEKRRQHIRCFPLVQRASQTLLSCCCATCFSGGFWEHKNVKIISAFQLKSRTTCSCHFCSKQPIKSRGGGFTTHKSFPFWCRQNRSSNNRPTVEHGRKVHTGCISLQMRFQGVFGVVTPGAKL